MSPPGATYMRPGAGHIYIYIQICIKQQVQETGHVSLPLMSTASLRVVGHECHKPLQQNEVLHLYRWYTHRRPAAGLTMKVRWQWKWDENYLTRTRRGEHKRRGKEQTPTQHTWPRASKPWQGKEKKRRPTETEPDQRRRGKTEAPEPTYHSETWAYLSTRRTQPTCREENTWDRGPMGD